MQRLVLTCVHCVQVLVTVDGIFANVLKFKPPMVFSDDDADRLLSALDSALRGLAAAQEEVAALDKQLLAAIEPGQRAAQSYFALSSAQDKAK